MSNANVMISTLDSNVAVITTTIKRTHTKKVFAKSRRVQHWDTRAFTTFLKENTNTPFKWGESDCALFASNGIKQMTGLDIAADFRGLYSNASAANAAILSVTGGSTVEDAAAYCANKAGFEEYKYPLMAKRGDLVVVEDSGRVIAGLVHLSGRHIVCQGEKGLMRKSITEVKRAWKV